MEKIKLTIPKKSEYMSTIRLTTSALSNVKGFNIDEIEDLKVIISEVCTFFISNVENNSEPLEINYEISGNNLIVEVTDLNSGEISEENRTNSDMCVMIIESLADNHNFDLENKKIIFEKCINNFE
jgi:serine/threonine-protein kinase RsbW